MPDQGKRRGPSHGVYRPPPPEEAAPGRTGPLVTEGMKARRREIEKKKREAQAQRIALEEEAREGWARVFKLSAVLGALALVVIGYRRLQVEYGNRWPLWLVWVFMAVALILAMGWLIWYLNKD